MPSHTIFSLKSNLLICCRRPTRATWLLRKWAEETIFTTHRTEHWSLGKGGPMGFYVAWGEEVRRPSGRAGRLFHNLVAARGPSFSPGGRSPSSVAFWPGTLGPVILPQSHHCQSPGLTGTSQFKRGPGTLPIWHGPFLQGNSKILIIRDISFGVLNPFFLLASFLLNQES